MWNRITSEFLGVFDPGPNVPPPDQFRQDYVCYPVSFAGREELEQGNKILLPQSALSILARMNVTWPMLFKIANNPASLFTHGGVLEFSAEEGTCFIPYWMMRNLLLSEGDVVQIVNTSLPKGTYVKLQPLTNDFLEISDHRAVLEYTMRHFAALTVGDCIVIHHNNQKYEIEIIECKPTAAISIIETDVQVDFASPPESLTNASKKQKVICVSNKYYQATASEVKSLDEKSDSSTSKNQVSLRNRLPGGVRTKNEEYYHLLNSGQITGIKIKPDLEKPSFRLFQGEGQICGDIKPANET